MAKILVVDDEPACRDATQVLLTARGYEVRTVADGREALKVADEFQPHVAVIDWMLRNEIDGAELAAQLAERCPATRCLVISGYPNVEADMSRQIPARHLLCKPVAPEELLRAIEEAVESR